MRRRRGPFGAVPFLLALGTALSAAPLPVSAQGLTVNWNFLRFRGPSDQIVDVFDPTSVVGIGAAINGTSPTLAGSGALAATGNSWGPNEGYALGQVTGLSGTSVTFGYNSPNRPPNNDNQISFAAASSVPQIVGVPFLLGTLSFTNGLWYGANLGNPSANVPSFFDFSLQTQSTNAAFNQTFEGSVVVVVHSTTSTNRTTLAEQQAEADWIYVTGQNTAGSNPVQGVQTTNALRVYDGFAAPLGASTTGTVELWAEFGSLSLLELRNPTGGNFVTSTIAALDPRTGTPLTPTPTPTPVPEPSGLLLLAAGLVGCTAVRARRRTN